MSAQAATLWSLRLRDGAIASRPAAETAKQYKLLAEAGEAFGYSTIHIKPLPRVANYGKVVIAASRADAEGLAVVTLQQRIAEARQTVLACEAAISAIEARS